MWRELKNYIFTCDECGDTEVVYEVTNHTLPQGWCREYSQDSETEYPKDICVDCLKCKMGL